ncbi:hypothetical protein VOM14_11620 [Paraburkholderia sp. MPAMCS5]|uniref:hypothetical protein n=1 Tax=Paraburkholderia sp. MPAMCS5 TaxID=3112563 RepID=UPI002E19FF36|nr:hypothetical protein [Paraburkholderia sp. MPAMCS5]
MHRIVIVGGGAGGLELATFVPAVPSNAAGSAGASLHTCGARANRGQDVTSGDRNGRVPPHARQTPLGFSQRFNDWPIPFCNAVVYTSKPQLMSNTAMPQAIKMTRSFALSRPGGSGVADVFVATAKKNGVDVVARKYSNDKATDFNAILTHIKAQRPEVIFYATCRSWQRARWTAVATALKVARHSLPCRAAPNSRLDMKSSSA